MVHLKEMNDKLIYGNADQITGNILNNTKSSIRAAIYGYKKVDVCIYTAECFDC